MGESPSQGRPAQPAFSQWPFPGDGTVLSSTSGGCSVSAPVSSAERHDRAPGVRPELEVDAALGAALSGRYALVRPIGRGGMGTVYLARDEVRDRYVALKVLHPDLAAEVSGARFGREVALLGSLAHPSVVSVLESDTTGEFAWFTMPLIQGESLRERLRLEERLRFGDIQAIVGDVAAGLDHVHEAGIVHRDLKPENILLAGGRALVADFGIARLFQPDSALAGPGTMTRAGQVLGTPAYMSPEQVAGHGVDPRSDVYSLGVVVYEMLVGSPPFQAPTAVQLMSLHLSEPPVPPRQKLEDIPASLEAAVLRALAKEPERRFDSAGAFARALTIPGGIDPDGARATTRPVIAVLDFVNVTQDPALEWLGTGLAETLSAELARMEGVRPIRRDLLVKVCPRPLALSDDESAQAVARSLGARWVLWGSFQGVAGKLRIRHRLADVATGSVRPPEAMEGPLADIFRIQDQLLDTVRRELAVDTPTATLTGILREHPGALTAYEHYIRGLTPFRHFGPRGFAEAWEHFERAVEADPRHAPALAGMGAICCFRFVGSSKTSDLEQAMDLLQRALAEDPKMAEAHVWLGYAHLRLGRFEESTRYSRRATELDPVNSFAHYMHGVSMMIHGMERHRWELFAASIPPLVRAIQLDPSDTASYFGLADTYLQAGQPEQALPLLQRAVVLERSGGTGGKVRLPGARALLGAAQRRLGKLAEARSILEEAVAA
ncbi:MAG: protein kinase domain-containing protein, partial [Myxococcaceae bacterium]